MNLRTFSLTILLVCNLSCAKKEMADHVRDTSALQRIFVDLEAQQVKAYRNQGWCQVLSYAGGQFANTNTGTCVWLADGPTKPFSAIARTDLGKMRKSIRSTGTGVIIISKASYDTSGKLNHAEFHWGRGFSRNSYVYDPGYTLPEDIPHERWCTAIDKNWYYKREDWN